MTASRLGGDPVGPSAVVFDQIGESWVAVALAPDKCRDATAEFWQVFTLRPGPDGSLAGDYTATAGNACADKRSVTFTRIGDVDVNRLPDPAKQPPRVVSPAQALRGHYRVTRTFADGSPQQTINTAVKTDCLRTGERCMSYFHEPSGDLPLIFESGKWTWNLDAEITCPRSPEPARMKASGQAPLPQPPGDPIVKVTGRGQQEQTPPCPVNTTFDETYTRTGD
jgi:serine/threonine-protein kinase